MLAKAANVPTNLRRVAEEVPPDRMISETSDMTDGGKANPTLIATQNSIMLSREQINNKPPVNSVLVATQNSVMLANDVLINSQDSVMLIKVGAMPRPVAERSGSEWVGNGVGDGGGGSFRLSPLDKPPAHHLVSGGSGKEDKDESQDIPSLGELVAKQHERQLDADSEPWYQGASHAETEQLARARLCHKWSCCGRAAWAKRRQRASPGLHGRTHEREWG